MGLFQRIKKTLKGTDELNNLSVSEKKQLNSMLRERRLELIAQKQLRKLEEKYNPTSKGSVSDTFAKIKAYRQNNLAKREQRMNLTEQKKERYHALEKARKGDLIMPGEIKPIKSFIKNVKPLSGKIVVPKESRTIGQKLLERENARKSKYRKY